LRKRKRRLTIEGDNLTIKSYKKLLKQIKHKPAKKKRFLKHSKPQERKHGIGKRKCKRCGKFGSHIRRYGLHLCRQCFRDLAREFGFKKYGHEV
jgi:small subunit ribosomal protein S14